MMLALASIFTLVAMLLVFLIWGGEDSGIAFLLALLWMLLAAMAFAVVAVIVAVRGTKRQSGRRGAIVVLALPGLLALPIAFTAIMNAIDVAFR